MTTDTFWQDVDTYLTDMTTATTADDVVRGAQTIFDQPADTYTGEAFFPGSGGENQLCESLAAAGWTFTRFAADYYWTAKAPDGTLIEYIEGDIYRR
jgi:hypothetical protein